MLAISMALSLEDPVRNMTAVEELFIRLPRSSIGTMVVGLQLCTVDLLGPISENLPAVITARIRQNNNCHRFFPFHNSFDN